MAILSQGETDPDFEEAVMTSDDELEVSIVMPCLNEEQTLGSCIEKGLAALQKYNIRGEIVISDNGSTDNSVAIAKSLGVRVVHQPMRGYGSAYLKGFEEARGKYIIMADSDNTYDFDEIDKFLERLRAGYDFVNGSRLRGKILPGAMTWSHQYIGNPFLSWFLNVLFRTGISDSHCGMRGFSKEAYSRMRLQTTGMEFASEMVINAAKAKLKMTEVPITYYPRAGDSKLRTFRDGWRHLRFMLLYSPTALFLVPGLIFFALGLVGLFALMPGAIMIGHRAFDIHFMILASMLTILGQQVFTLGLYAKTYSLTAHFDEDDPLLVSFYRHFSLEKGLLLGLVLFTIGFVTDAYVLVEWISRGFGALNQVRTALFALTFVVIGAQTIFASFFLSMLSIRREREDQSRHRPKADDQAS
ncbi:MAG: glycosyltransferase family 2 protein [Chloroflexi bacterium]|nr:glycosyltransferase family 2 protein [Chloroflexota bacterium]